MSLRRCLLAVVSVAACDRAAPKRADTTAAPRPTPSSSASATVAASSSASATVAASSSPPVPSSSPPETVLCIQALPTGDWSDLGKGAHQQEQFALPAVGHRASVTIGRAVATVDQAKGACLVGLPTAVELRVSVLRDGTNEGFFVKLSPGVTDLGFDTMYANWRTRARAVDAGALSCDVCPANARTVVRWAP